MSALIAVGLGSYNGSFENSCAMNWCCLGCFCAGALLLGAAYWFLSQAPEAEAVALPIGESPR